jgi:hypothetical protein
LVKTQKWPYLLVLNTGKFLPLSVFGVPNTGIPVSVYTGLETLVSVPQKCCSGNTCAWHDDLFQIRMVAKPTSTSSRVKKLLGGRNLRMVWGRVTCVSGYSYHMSVRTRLSDRTKQTKFQNQQPSNVETPVPSI